MRTSVLTSAAIALTGLVFLTGCPPTVNTVDVRPGAYDWIKTDSGLADVAKVVAVRQKREADHLRVEVDVRNLWSTRQGIQYQFTWTDADGFAISTPFAWQTDFIEGGQQKTIWAVAPDARATNCRLELKRFIQ